jgi:carbamoyltransferase
MRILSIHFGHDSSICLYNNGIVEKYFLVERFTRIKHDLNISKLLNIIFDNIKCKVDIISLSTFNDSFDYSYIATKIFKNYQKYNNELRIISNSDHHLNHAFLSFYNSNFKKAIVVVVDGSGSFVDDNVVEVESIYHFFNKKYELIYKNAVEKFSSALLPWDKKFNDIPTKYDYKNIFGIGGLYDIAAILTGNTEDDCGKAMGLSSYGKPNKNFKNLFLETNTLNNNFYSRSPEQIKYFLKNPIKKITKENYKLHADFCYEVQIQTQKAVGDLIEKAIKKTKLKNVCISGGYGMNIVSNYYYLQRFPDVEFYFEPICNDSGVSIGSAISSYIKLTDRIPNSIKNTFFHGTFYDISKYKGKLSSITDIAKILYQNKSVAVYTGLAETGQRALGNRSILFNALNPNAKELVNKIKKREWYRPFACMVLEEDANTYFDMGRIKSSPFMTICFPVRPEYVKIIPGVTHVDNTCRIQTVSKEDNYLYKLLQEFKKLSGHGILLNTSFNLAGEPLVETPEDAFNTLNNSCLDYLWFEETQQLIPNSKFTFNYV